MSEQLYTVCELWMTLNTAWHSWTSTIWWWRADAVLYGQLRTTDSSIQTETSWHWCSNWTSVAGMLTRTGCSRPMPGPMTELSSVVKALPRTSSYTNTTINCNLHWLHLNDSRFSLDLMLSKLAKYSYLLVQLIILRSTVLMFLVLGATICCSIVRPATARTITMTLPPPPRCEERTNPSHRHAWQTRTNPYLSIFSNSYHVPR